MSNTVGENTAVGALSLDANTTGGNNTAVGYGSLGANTTGGQNTTVGHSSLDACTTGVDNVAVGYSGLGATTTGSYNTAVGKNCADNLTTGSYNVMVGCLCDPVSATSSNAQGFGYNLSCSDNYTTIGQGAADIRAEHGVATWSTVSDERVKKDIEDSTVGLNFINDLRPVTFNYRNKGELPKEFKAYEEDSTEVYKSEKSQHGFIAQEVKAAIDKHSDIKDGFSMWDDDDNTGQQRVGETALIPMLTKAVQELSAKVEELEDKLNKE